MLALRELERRQGCRNIDRGRLYRHHQKVGELDHHANLDIGTGRAIDQQDVVVSSSPQDLASEPPTGRRHEAELRAAPSLSRFASLMPASEAALGIGIDKHHVVAELGPSNTEVCGKRRLASPALALCDEVGDRLT